jgi:outer membrane protein OmpU
MKKILLATTILGMTAGFAAAEVKISGSASMGIARDGDNTVQHGNNDGEFHVYNSGTIAFGATVVSDAGVEFGMSTDVTFGNSYSFADDEGFATEEALIGAPTLTAKGAFGTLTFADDGIDQLYSDAPAGDVSYAYSAGDLSFTIVSDVDASTVVDWSANVGYTMSGVALSLTTDANDSYNVSASYTTGGITGTIETDSEAGADAVNTLTVAYAANGMSVEVSADSADSTSISVGYSANGMSVDLSTDQDAAWEATTSYDLGGGATLVAGMNAGEEAYAGVDLSF